MASDASCMFFGPILCCGRGDGGSRAMTLGASCDRECIRSAVNGGEYLSTPHKKTGHQLLVLQLQGSGTLASFCMKMYMHDVYVLERKTSIHSVYYECIFFYEKMFSGIQDLTTICRVMFARK